MSNSGATVTKFGIIEGVSAEIADFVAVAIQNATKEFIAQGGPSVVSGVPLYSNTQGKLVTSSPYSMPTTLGAPGEVIIVDPQGNLGYGNAAGLVDYLSQLTVTELSQGPSVNVQNYTFPDYPPGIDDVMAGSGFYVMNLGGAPQKKTVMLLRTINNGDVPITTFFNNSATAIDDVLNLLSVSTRRALQQVNCVANITYNYNPGTNRFSFSLDDNTTPSNFIFLRWDNYVAGVNDNNLFGVSNTNIALQLPPPQTVICPDPAIGVSVSSKCVWRSVTTIPVSTVSSPDGSASIQCEDVGVGQSGIISYGNYNLNNGSISNCGNINALDNCNITTSTTQIENGLGELNISINSLPRITQNAIKTKLECGTSRLQLAAVSDLLTDDTSTYFASQNALLTKNMAIAIASDTLVINQDYGAVNRLVVDDSITGLYSKNATSGPAGSLLELNNDNTFTLGCYFANNGIIECRPDSMAMYGNSANSAVIMTGTNITTSLSNGSGRIDREILSTASQSFRDPTGTERLRIDGNGVVINNTYQLTNDVGTLGQVLSTNGAGQTGWQYPVKIQDSGNPSSFINCDSENIYVSTFYPTGTLQLGIQASISAGQVLTSTDTLGSASWQNPQIYGLYSQTGTQTVANTIVETTLIGSGVGSLSVPANYFTAGMAFRYNTGGTFRDNANNTTFRFRLRNGGILFDSGNLTLPLITVVSAWNIDVTFSYIGGTTLITNFNFQYNAGSDARGFTSQNTNTTLNTTIPNTLNFTVQWGAASANNTITTNFGVLQKIY